MSAAICNLYTMPFSMKSFFFADQFLRMIRSSFKFSQSSIFADSNYSASRMNCNQWLSPVTATSAKVARYSAMELCCRFRVPDSIDGHFRLAKRRRPVRGYPALSYAG